MNLRTLLGLLFLAAACGPEPVEAPVDAIADASSELKVPKEDHADTVDIGSWNVEAALTS